MIREYWKLRPISQVDPDIPQHEASAALNKLPPSLAIGRTLALVLAFLALPFSLDAATPVFKCTTKGSVTYQSSPCPSGEVRPPPTFEQLNAAQQKKLVEAGKAPATQPAPAEVAKDKPSAAGAPPASPGTSFRCDGRVYCSQMTSCAEAKFFLRNCPGTKMDGDRNGIPCEQQWCG